MRWRWVRAALGRRSGDEFEEKGRGRYGMVNEKKQIKGHVKKKGKKRQKEEVSRSEHTNLSYFWHGKKRQGIICCFSHSFFGASSASFPLFLMTFKPAMGDVTRHGQGRGEDVAFDSQQ